MDPDLQKELSNHIESDEYTRQRWAPEPGDGTYLVLSDLRMALDRFKTSDKIVVLDFGCGGSPYRGLFDQADYRRADYAEASGLDYAIEPGKPLKEADETFDVILSTQVLEHVENPNAYLQECHRLLKPGGRLILSTHGSFEDHGCPYDFQRWTADGLRRDLTAAQFENIETTKITTGPRAALYYYQRHFEHIVLPKRTLLGLVTALFRRLNQRNRRLFHIVGDRSFPEQRVVDSHAPGQHALYIVLMATCLKPESPTHLAEPLS